MCLVRKREQCSRGKLHRLSQRPSLGVAGAVDDHAVACRRFVSMTVYDQRARSASLPEGVDASAGPALAALIRLAAQAAEVPWVRLGFLDANGRWHSASAGPVPSPDIVQEKAFVDLVVAEHALLIVPDATLDGRMVSRALPGKVAHIRFCAGAPIVVHGDRCVGALCVFDDHARQLDAAQGAALRDLAMVCAEIVGLQSDERTRDAASADAAQVAELRGLERLRLANIISAARAGTWEWNVRTDQLRINDRWAALIGTTPEALAPITLWTWKAHTHPADWTQLREAMHTQLSNRCEYVDCEIRMRHLLQHWVWVRIRGRVATWADDGSPLWMYGTLFDISIPKETERRLRESEAFLDRTGRVAGVGGWEIDLESNALSWSDETCRIHEVPLGHRPTLEEALGHFPGGSAGAVGIAMRSGIGSRTGWDLETPFVTRTGRNLWVRSVASVELQDGQARWLVGALQDVTLRRKAVDALQLSERRFRKLFERSLGLICTHDMDGVILSVNPATAHQLGYPLTDILGRPMTDFIEPAYHGAYAKYLQRIAAKGIDNGFLHVVAMDGSTHVWQYENVVDDEGDERFVLGHAQDVTESQRQASQLRDWSIRDPLTRCFNRRYLSEISASLRDDEVWGCIALDLDHFKRVNDTQGHERGDEVLVAMGRFLAEHVRPEDIVVRLGGDEFLVLLKGSGEAATAAAADRIKADAALAPIRFTLGQAVRRENTPLGEAMRRADQQLYNARAKRPPLDVGTH